MPISDFIRKVLLGTQASDQQAAQTEDPSNPYQMAQQAQGQPPAPGLSDIMGGILHHVIQAAIQPSLPNRQQDLREAQLGQQQSQFEQQMAAEQARANTMTPYQRAMIQDAQDKMDIEMIKQGFRKKVPDGGLQGQGPSFGGGGGQGVAPSQTGPDPISMMLPWKDTMQGAPSQTPNAANTQSPITTPGMRATSPPTASAGGVIAPAQPQTVTVRGNEWIPPSGASSIPPIQVPEDLQDIYGKEPIPVDSAAHAFQVRQDFAKMRESLKKPLGGKEDDNVRIERDAAQAVAKDHGVKDPSGIKAIGDLPLEQREEAWNRKADMHAGATAVAAKEAARAAAEARAKEVQEAHDSDTAVYGLVKRDGQALFDIKDTKQQQRIIAMAAKEGYKLPTRQIPKTGQMNDSLLAADTVQQSIRRMADIAKALGPNSFGAVAGRLLDAEGKWGSPMFTEDGDPRKQLEQDFRTLATGLTAQETKLVGGGRASVQLYNAMKEITPNMKMDLNTFLQGAMHGTFSRAQMTKNAIKRWAYGDIENPFTQFSPYKKGDIVTHKDGKRYKLTSDPDEKGNATFEPVP